MAEFVGLVRQSLRQLGPWRKHNWPSKTSLSNAFSSEFDFNCLNWREWKAKSNDQHRPWFTNDTKLLTRMYLICVIGSPGLWQTLAVLIAGKLNMKKPPETSIVRRVSVSMPMDHETFRDLFGRLPSAPHYLQVFGNLKFSVLVEELDNIMPSGWSVNTFKTSTTCRFQPGKPVEIALLESKKVFFDHSRCSRCEGGDGAPVACKDVIRKVVYGSYFLMVSYYRERNKPAQKKPKERTRLTWAKPRDTKKTSDLAWTEAIDQQNKRLL